MNKLIQLKDKNDSYYPRNAIKQVSNLAIMIGGSITDLNIKKAKQIIIYYIVDIKNNYYSSITVSAQISNNWYNFKSSLGKEAYVMIQFKLGVIIVSDYCYDGFKIVGYDIVF